MTKTTELNNAKITGTMLGYEDHGMFTSMLYLEWKGGGVGFGGWSLDEYSKAAGKRIDTVGLGTEYIKMILETVGVEKWEQLVGQYVVVETGGIGSTCTGIRHITDDTKWFRPKVWFHDRGFN